MNRKECNSFWASREICDSLYYHGVVARTLVAVSYITQVSTLPLLMLAGPELCSNGAKTRTALAY